MGRDGSARRGSCLLAAQADRMDAKGANKRGSATGSRSGDDLAKVAET